MTFKVMEVLNWIERECNQRKAAPADYLDACRLAAEVQGKGGSEKDACLAVRSLLDKRFPKQENMKLD